MQANGEVADLIGVVAPLLAGGEVAVLVGVILELLAGREVADLVGVVVLLLADGEVAMWMGVLVAHRVLQTGWSIVVAITLASPARLRIGAIPVMCCGFPTGGWAAQPPACTYSPTPASASAACAAASRAMGTRKGEHET